MTAIQTKKLHSNGRRNRTTEATIDAKNLAAMRLLDSWDDATTEDIAEQRATWVVVEKGLQENPVTFRTD